jgi:hypothetical protein
MIIKNIPAVCAVARRQIKIFFFVFFAYFAVYSHSRAKIPGGKYEEDFVDCFGTINGRESTAGRPARFI